MIDTKEAAEFTGFTVAYIRMLVQWRQIPFYKRDFSRVVMFNKQELIDWKSKRTRKNSKETKCHKTQTQS